MKDLVGSQLTILGNGIGHFHKAIEAGLESDLNAGAFAEGAKKLTPLESLDQTSSQLLDLKSKVGYNGRMGKGKATGVSSSLSDWDDLDLVSGSNHPQNYFYNKKKMSLRPSPKD